MGYAEGEMQNKSKLRPQESDQTRLQPAPVDHDQLFNFRLWKLMSLTSAPVIRLCEGKYGISRREWLVLAVLARDGECSPSSLAERATLDRARASRAISTLSLKQLVGRVEQRGDRRRALVNLSETGCSLVRELHPQIAEINARVLAALDVPTRAAFNEILQLLTKQAAIVNQDLALDVHADRHRGGARRAWLEDHRLG